MKNIVTASVFAIISATSASAGPIAANVIDPVEVKIQNLEVQVEGLTSIAKSLGQIIHIERTQFNDRITELDEDISVLHDQIANSDTLLDLDAAQDEIQDLLTEIDDLESDLYFAENDVESLTVQVEENDITIVSLQEDLAATQDALAEMTEDRDYQRTLKRENAAEITELEEVIESMEANNNDQALEAMAAEFQSAIDQVNEIANSDSDNAIEEVLDFLNGLDIDVNP